MAREVKQQSDSNQEYICSPDTFNGGFMHSIHIFYVTVQKHLEQKLHKEGKVSFSQFLVLVGFYCEGQSTLTQAKLAEYLTLTEATVSRHITVLVTKKLLSKEKDQSNKKIYNLRLTEEGKKVVEHSKRVITQELDLVFNHIPDKDKNSIIKHFNQAIAFLHTKK